MSPRRVTGNFFSSYLQALARPARANLYIKDFPERWSLSELRAFFSQFGQILESKILPRNVPSSIAPGASALMNFASADDAEYVIKNVNGMIPPGRKFPSYSFSWRGGRAPFQLTLTRCHVSFFAHGSIDYFYL